MTKTDAIKLVASNAARPCIDCRYFMEDESFQRFGWFGLRRDVTTSNSVRFATCAKHFNYASIARSHDCKGRDFE